MFLIHQIIIIIIIINIIIIIKVKVIFVGTMKFKSWSRGRLVGVLFLYICARRDGRSVSLLGLFKSGKEIRYAS
jgi:hypothetical protein